MPYTYNPDATLDGLIEHFAWDRDTAHLLPAATEAELEALSNEITRRLEVNAAAVSALVSQDETHDAAYLRICFFWTIGGARCWVDCEVSNVGDTGSPIINIIPTITRKEDYPMPTTDTSPKPLTVREIYKAADLTQTALAARFGIPLRTVGNWCTGTNKCPDYTRRMMMECLGLLKK